MNAIARWSRTLALTAAAGALGVPVVASAQLVTLRTVLSGAQERPDPTPSPGDGFGRLIYHQPTGSLRLTLSAGGLLGETMGVGPGGAPAHVHIITNENGTGPIVIPITLAPVGATSFGPVVQRWTLSDLAAIPGINLLALGMLETELNSLVGAAPGTTSRLYYNVHTTEFGPGEIRGDLVVSAIPEPSTYLLMASGLAGVGLITLRRRRGA